MINRIFKYTLTDTYNDVIEAGKLLVQFDTDGFKHDGITADCEKVEINKLLANTKENGKEYMSSFHEQLFFSAIDGGCDFHTLYFIDRLDSNECEPFEPEVSPAYVFTMDLLADIEIN